MARLLPCRRSIDGHVSQRCGSMFELSGRAAALAALFLFVTLAGFASTASARMVREIVTIVTATGEISIDTEIANTPEEKALGLMFRTQLPDNQGMLFHYVKPLEITMWMKNTYITLDMVFIKADGTIHRIEVRTEPLSESIISSKGDVVAVLELAGGAAERLGVKVGGKVKHRLFK